MIHQRLRIDRDIPRFGIGDMVIVSLMRDHCRRVLRDVVCGG